MATYKGICKETNKEETIWFDMCKCESNNNIEYKVGLMRDCSVKKNDGRLNVCKDCNILKKLQ